MQLSAAIAAVIAVAVAALAFVGLRKAGSDSASDHSDATEPHVESAAPIATEAEPTHRRHIPGASAREPGTEPTKGAPFERRAGESLTRAGAARVAESAG